MDGNTAYNIGSFIGAHIFLLVGVLLLWRAYKIHRRIKNAKKTSLLQQDIERIGSHQ